MLLEKDILENVRFRIIKNNLGIYMTKDDKTSITKLQKNVEKGN